MLRDVRDYTAALDFNIDTPADRRDLHSESPRGGVSPSGGAMPEGPALSFSPSLSLVPTLTSASASTPTSAQASAVPNAMTGCATRYVPPRGVTPAVTRSQATRQNQTPAIAGNQGNSRNISTTIAERFRLGTLSLLREQVLLSTEAHDIIHQMYYRGPFSVEYTYATTNLWESCLREGK